MLLLTPAVWCASRARAAHPAMAHHAAGIFTSAQAEALIAAWRAGDRYGLGYTLAAIVWQESSGCLHLTGDGGLAHGCAQVHLATARYIAGTQVSAWMLAHDRGLNLRIAARFLAQCVRRYGWRGGIGCYHVGLPRAQAMGRRAVSGLAYVRAVESKVRALRAAPISEE